MDVETASRAKWAPKSNGAFSLARRRANVGQLEPKAAYIPLVSVL